MNKEEIKKEQMNKEEIKNAIVALNYSKGELQQVNQQFGVLATAVSLIIVTLTSVMFYFLKNTNIDKTIIYAVAGCSISLQLFSLIILLVTIVPTLVNANESSVLYFKHLYKKEPDSEIFSNNLLDQNFIKTVKNTIVINAKITNNKYELLRAALILSMLSLLPMSLIAIPIICAFGKTRKQNKALKNIL